MLRSLGQNPTDEELKDLIDSVDDEDKDGQIQLREFLKLYTQSLDTKKSGKTGMEDVANVFNALGVRTTPPAPARGCHARLSPVPRAHTLTRALSSRRETNAMRLRRSTRRMSPISSSPTTSSRSTPTRLERATP